MGGAAIALLSAMGAMSLSCGHHPVGYRCSLSRFSAGSWRVEAVRALGWGPRQEFGWWGIIEKKCGRSAGCPGGPVCVVQSGGGGSHGAATTAFRMPILERDENQKLVLRSPPETKSFEAIERDTPIPKKSSPSRKSNAIWETKTVVGKPVRGLLGTKTQELRENGSSIPKSNSARKSSGETGPGQPPSTGASSPVKVNLSTLDPKARRLASAKAHVRGAPLYSKAARRFYNEKFRTEPQRLSKVLAAAGVASRRACEEVIFTGRVAVNGNVCKVPQTPVDPLKDVIYVDGHSLPKKMAPKLYFALNKPKGYICSAGEEGTKPVLSLFDDYFKVWMQRNPGLAKPRMFTVGRLDVASCGLLLVTNDGDFAQKVSHPSSGLTKEYAVTVNEKVTRRQLQVIAGGTMVQGSPCVPKEVELFEMESGEERQRLRIVVGEGRNHEVRHLVENSGLQVLALKRIRIGSLRLSRKLGNGKFDLLTVAQVANLMK